MLFLIAKCKFLLARDLPLVFLHSEPHLIERFVHPCKEENKQPHLQCHPCELLSEKDWDKHSTLCQKWAHLFRLLILFLLKSECLDHLNSIENHLQYRVLLPKKRCYLRLCQVQRWAYSY